MSQKDIVKDKLKTTGEITRNWCLSQYISRLSAIIQILEQEGWEFETSSRGGDYVYTLKNRPKKIIRYDLDPVRNVRYPVYG